MPRLSKENRERCVGMLQAGMSQNAVAATVGTSQKTISLLWRRFQTTGSTDDRPRSGRPRVTTPREDRQIRLLHLRNRFLTAVDSAQNALGRRISSQTVRNRLKRCGLKARRPYKGTELTDRHKTSRRNWARHHLRFRVQDWSRVLFSDESRFSLKFADGRTRVWRRRGERFAGCCVTEVDRFGGGSVMVWGGICGGNRTRLVVVNGTLTSQRYRDEILSPVVLPYLRTNGPGLTFQQDNATAHTARATREFLNQNNVDMLDWPSKSPDLSPIEHVWDELGRRVRMRRPQPQNLLQLATALEEEWNNIPGHVIQRYVSSMRRRCVAVLNAGGGHTRY